MINFQQTNLPICDVLNELQNSLAQNTTVILSAPPGAGKSTLVPLALLEEAWLNNQKIIMLLYVLLLFSLYYFLSLVGYLIL